MFALALGGCGGGSSGQSTGGGTTAGTAAAAKSSPAAGDPSATAHPGAKESGSATDSPKGAKANANAVIDAGPCGPQLDQFLADLGGLRKNLVVGVSYEQYVSELGVLRKIYDRIPVDAMSFACLSGAAESAEQSFDGYLAAANTWGDCVSDSACETTEIEPKLQSRWKLSARQLKRAQAAAG